MNGVTRLLIKKGLKGILESFRTVQILLEEREKTTGEDAPEALHIKLQEIEAKIEVLIDDLTKPVSL